MKTFMTLLRREWREWRTVMIVIGSLYLLGMIGSSVALHKGSNALIRGDIHSEWETFRGFGDDDDDEIGWLTPKEMAATSKSQALLFGWTHMLRVGVSFINLALLVLALFYLTDAVFKERSDGSTFFYRGLPIGDLTVLSSKLAVGTAGILGLSFIFGVFWVLVAQITFPGRLTDLLSGAGLSPFQVASFDFIGDWLVFHILQLAWLLPFASYFLLVSTVTRSRPLLVGVGVPLLLGLLWRFLVGDNALLTELVANLDVIGETLRVEWLGTNGPHIAPGEPIELFGSFSSYVFSLRTLVSLFISGGFFGLTFFAYRKNLPVS